MARTHGVRPGIVNNDGVLLGKGGEPIPVTPVRGVSALYPHGSLVEVAEPPPETVAPVRYEWLCDSTTWQRNMDGYQAMHLLNTIFGGLSVVLTDEQVRKLPSDTRWHFRRRVAKEVETEE